MAIGARIPYNLQSLRGKHVSPKSGGGALAALAITGALASMYGGYKQARATKAVASAQKDIAAIRAREESRRGREEEARSRKSFRKLLGKQRAAMAAQGISLTGGSAQDILQETQDVSELDALTIRLNAMRSAFGIQSEGIAYGAEARRARSEARMKPLTSLLSGGLQAFQAYKMGGKL